MKKVISTEQVPIKLWLDNIEEGALEQAKNLANLPFSFRHIAIMPDSHQGYGMPIGGVLATDGVIIPNAVGVDVGCGMCAVKTSLTHIKQETLKNILGDIRKEIPLGKNHNKEAQDYNLMPGYSGNMKIVDEQFDSARKQLGTLGGGNHFIEIQKGSDGYIWIMIHSGSRNLGKKVADYYNKLAIELNEKWKIGIPKSYQLAYLPANSQEGSDYLKEMKYCVEFAKANRKLMMEKVCKIVKRHKPFHASIESECGLSTSDMRETTFEPMIDVAHNYATIENHFKHTVWVHRKGATSAKKDEIGIIPGSQGTASYIVKGLGNPESFMSCSHGAGRKMSRAKAQTELNLEEEKKKLDDQGILHAIRGKSDLDEASGAYKDIDEVMENQKDLVEILIKLTPLAVVKG